MSFVITVSTSSVLYTPPTGAESAFAGQTIASATWNATFTDLSNNGLAVVGTAQANTIKGNTTSAVGVVADMTLAQAQILIKQGLIAIPTRGVNFQQTGVDVSISISSPTVRYQVDQLAITNLSGSLAASGVSLYTGAGKTGVAIALSQSIVNLTVTTSDAGNNMARVVLTSASIIALDVSVLYFNIVNPSGGAATADVILYVRPM